MDRREFLKGVAIVGGTAAFAGLAGCTGGQQAAADSGITWDDEADVVIVGAGGGGLAAAYEATKAGQSVLVVEWMTNHLQSNSAICAGMIQGAVTSVQKKLGIEDSAEEYDKYLAAVAEGMANEDLRKLFAQKSGETIDWLIGLGVEFPGEQLSTMGTMVDYYTDVTPSVARMHWVKDMSGANIVNPVYDAATAQGARFQFDTRVTRLITSADGEVVGVAAAAGDTEKKYKAKKGVVINTAGFTRNPEMLKSYMQPAMPGCDAVFGTYGSMAQQGDGILMGQAIGAELTNMWCSYNLAPGLMRDEMSGGFLAIGMQLPGIFISMDGKRHVLEGGLRSSEETIADIWKQPGGFVWAVWDQSVVDSGTPVAMNFSTDLAAEVESGYVLTAPTATELAQAMAVDAATLEQSLATYNSNAAAGTDPELGKFLQLTPLVTPPYYAAKVVAVSPDTAGGLSVNTNLQVLSVRGEVIPRLYAVGNTTGGFKGKINPGCGQALGWTYTGGRIAGQHVATLAAWA